MGGRKRAGKKDVASKLSRNIGAIRAFGIKKIGIFGSVARGEQGGASDIDILVEFENGQGNFSNLMGLYFYLRELLGRDIDLVTREGLSPYLAPYILKEVEYIEAAS